MLAKKYIWFFTYGFLAIVGLIFFSTKADAATYYRSSTTPANFLSGACWSASSCGVAGMSWPTASSDIVNIGCALKTTTIGSGGTCGDLNISNGTVNITGGTLYIWGNLNLSGGTLNISGTANVVIYGNFNKTAGTFSHTGGTVNMGGSGTQNLNSNSSPLTFYNLAISSSGNRIMNNNLTVTNTLTLTNGYLSVGSYTLQVGTSSSGNDITEGSGKITITSSSNLSFGGSVVATLSNILSNTSPWTINNFTMFRNLSTITLGGNLTVNGAFNLCGGSATGSGDVAIGSNTLTLNGTVTSAMSGSIIGSASSDIIIGGSGACSLYFDLSSTIVGGSNTIRNFTLNRTSNTFYPLTNLRIGGDLSITSGAKFSVANPTASSQVLKIDGTWSGAGVFVGNSAVNSSEFQILGSGALSTPLKMDQTSASTRTLTVLRIERTGSPIMQLGSNLNIYANIFFKNATSTYGSLDINGYVIDLGSAGIIYNENTDQRIFCSSCTANSTSSYISATMDLGTGTVYEGVSSSPSQIGYRGTGLDITTRFVAPGITTIKRGFAERSGNDLASSVLRYFNISPTTNAALDAAISFHYWDSEGNTLVEAENSLYRDNSGSNGWVDKGGTSSPGTGDNIVILSGINEFSDWSVGKTTIVTPVKLTKFEADCYFGKIHIKWTTNSEINNDYFSIEKSIDAKKWELAGIVSGSGNTNEIKEYSFIDINPLSSNSYYRLTQTDFDGKLENFRPVHVNCIEELTQDNITIYPNPADDFVIVVSQNPSTAKIILSDLTGRIISEYMTENLSHPLRISLKELKSGAYLLNIIESENYSVLRLVKN